MEEYVTIANAIYSLLALIFGGVGTLLTWFGLRKFDKRRAISESVKDTKVNDVEGQKVVLGQLDLLHTIIAKMSDDVLALRINLNRSNVNEIQYKTTIAELQECCLKFCVDAASAKVEIEKILDALNKGISHE